MAKIVKSFQGELVDFDLLQLEALKATRQRQVAAANMQARREYVESKVERKKTVLVGVKYTEVPEVAEKQTVPVGSKKTKEQ